MKPSPCHLALSALEPDEACHSCGHPAKMHRSNKHWREPVEVEIRPLKANWKALGGEAIEAAAKVDDKIFRPAAKAGALFTGDAGIPREVRSADRVIWACSRCGNTEWESQFIGSMPSIGCPFCSGERKMYVPADELQDVRVAACAALMWAVDSRYWPGETKRAVTALVGKLEEAVVQVAKLEEDLSDVRELCAEAGCSDPGVDAVPRTLCMVEELRQRGVCTETHDSEERKRLVAVEGAVRTILRAFGLCPPADPMHPNGPTCEHGKHPGFDCLACQPAIDAEMREFEAKSALSDEDRSILVGLYRATGNYVTGGGVFPASEKEVKALAQARDLLRRLGVPSDRIG